MAKRYPSDIWEQIRNEYRAGQLSVRDIAKAFQPDGPTEAAIRSRAKKGENGVPWERDLTDQVRAATRAKLNAADALPSAKPQEIIAAAADRNFKAVQAHMKSLGRLAELEEKLFERIERGFADMDVFDEAENIMERITAAIDMPKARQVEMAFAALFTPEMDRATLLKNLTRCVSDVTTAVGKRIQLERQALNIDKADDKPAGVGGWTFEAYLSSEPANEEAACG